MWSHAFDDAVLVMTLLALPLGFFAYHVMLAPPPASVLMQNATMGHAPSSGFAGRVLSVLAHASSASLRRATASLEELAVWVLRRPRRAV